MLQNIQISLNANNNLFSQYLTVLSRTLVFSRYWIFALAAWFTTGLFLCRKFNIWGTSRKNISLKLKEILAIWKSLLIQKATYLSEMNMGTCGLQWTCKNGKGLKISWMKNSSPSEAVQLVSSCWPQPLMRTENKVNGSVYQSGQIIC